MAITVTTDRTKKVQIKMSGGEFTACIRTLRGRHSARAAVTFARVQRGIARVRDLFPAPGAESAPGDVDVVDSDQQEAILEAMADTMDDLVVACAYGLESVEGLNGADGKPLLVPESMRDREDFIDSTFDFPQMVDITMATIEYNSLTEADAGN